MARLIGQLDAEGQDDRAKAASKLKSHGLLAEPQIRAAIEKARDPEVQGRVQDLLKR